MNNNINFIIGNKPIEVLKHVEIRKDGSIIYDIPDKPYPTRVVTAIPTIKLPYLDGVIIP